MSSQSAFFYFSHIKDPYLDVNKIISEDEMGIEYFRMLDLDQNGVIDGLESLKKMLELRCKFTSNHH